MLLSPRIRLSLAILATTAALCGQADYFVDGTLGVDAPGHGTSVSSPWRTIAHALANAQAPANGAVVVQVRGDQVYSPGTNGETFPLLVPPGVALEGVAGSQGQRPVLLLPAGATGLLLAPAASFDDSYCLLRGLAIEGGDMGVQLGSQAGQQHRVRIEDCDLRLQVGPGVQVLATGGIDLLTVRASRFGPSPTGASISMSPPWSSSDLQVDLEQCQMTGLADAVRCQTQAGGTGCRPRVNLLRCNIEHCQHGLNYSGIFGAGYATRLESTRIGCGSHGIDMIDTGSYLGQALELVDCTLVQLVTGITVESGPFSYPGTKTVTMQGCVVASCQTGVQLRWIYNPPVVHRLTVTDCTFRDNGTSILGQGNGDNGQMLFSISRCRFLRGGTAISASFYSYWSLLTIEGSVIAEHDTAVAFAGFPGDWMFHWPARLQIDGTTIADNHTALAVPEVGPSSADSILFSGNLTDVVATPALTVSHSLTDRPTLPGTNNQVLTDAQLLRPSYQLAPTSPCIDPVGSDIGADQFVPAGSLRPYGTPGTSPLGATQRIGSPDTTAPVGSTFTVSLSAALPAGIPPPPAQAILALGFAEPAPPLPFDLAIAGIAGVLWVDPLIFELPIAGSAAGTAAIQQTIPDFTWLAGLPVFYQWLVVSPLDGMVTSDGLRVTFGS